MKPDLSRQGGRRGYRHPAGSTGVTVRHDPRRRAVEIAVDGELGTETSTWILAAISGLLAEYAPESVVIDLARVDFIDGRGISLLLRAEQLVTDRGARFALADPNPLVADTIRLAEVDDWLGPYQTGRAHESGQHRHPRR